MIPVPYWACLWRVPRKLHVPKWMWFMCCIFIICSTIGCNGRITTKSPRDSRVHGNHKGSRKHRNDIQKVVIPANAGISFPTLACDPLYLCQAGNSRPPQKKPTPCRHRQSVEWASGDDPGVNAVDETAAGEPTDKARSSSGSIQEPTPTMPR